MHLWVRFASARRVAALSLCACLLPADAIANEPLHLFDGESLEGWEGDLSGWEVVNGTLASIPGEYARIYAQGDFANFVLSFEFRLTPGANNGVALRAPSEGDPAYAGMEVQILDDNAPIHASLEPYQYHGSIYGIVPASRGALKPVGEWNEQQIVCRGSKVKVTLNGSTIIDADLSIAAPRGLTLDGKPHPGLNRESGKVGLLGHGDRVFLRNLTVVRLD